MMRHTQQSLRSRTVRQPCRAHNKRTEQSFRASRTREVALRSSPARPLQGDCELKRRQQACCSNGRPHSCHPCWQSQRQQHQQKQACRHVVLQTAQCLVRTENTPVAAADDCSKRQGAPGTRGEGGDTRAELIALSGHAAHHVPLSVQPSAKVGFDLRVVEDLR